MKAGKLRLRTEGQGRTEGIGLAAGVRGRRGTNRAAREGGATCEMVMVVVRGTQTAGRPASTLELPLPQAAQPKLQPPVWLCRLLLLLRVLQLLHAGRQRDVCGHSSGVGEGRAAPTTGRVCDAAHMNTARRSDPPNALPASMAGL